MWCKKWLFCNSVWFSLLSALSSNNRILPFIILKYVFGEMEMEMEMETGRELDCAFGCQDPSNSLMP